MKWLAGFDIMKRSPQQINMFNQQMIIVPFSQIDSKKTKSHSVHIIADSESWVYFKWITSRSQTQVWECLLPSSAWRTNE